RLQLVERRVIAMRQDKTGILSLLDQDLTDGKRRSKRALQQLIDRGRHFAQRNVTRCGIELPGQHGFQKAASSSRTPKRALRANEEGGSGRPSRMTAEKPSFLGHLMQAVRD